MAGNVGGETVAVVERREWLKESRLMWVTCNVLLVRGGRINYFISETQFSFLRTCLDILLPSFLLFPSQLPAYSRDDLWEGMMNTRVSTCDDEILMIVPRDFAVLS